MTETETPAAPTSASQVAHEHLIAAYARDRAGEHPTPADVENAVREAVRTYAPYHLPERPVDVVVQLADEDGLEVEQTLHLTREQAARPELLGSAVGHAVAAAIDGFYVADDGTARDDARSAAVIALDAR